MSIALEKLSDEAALRKAVQVVAEARERLDVAQASRDALWLELMATPVGHAWANMEDTVQRCKSAVVLAESDLRVMAEMSYRANENPTPVEGVVVKLFKKFVYETSELLAWSEKHAPALVERKLVKDAEKVAALMPDAPVKVMLEPRARISKDLSDYLYKAVKEQPGE